MENVPAGSKPHSLMVHTPRMIKSIASMLDRSALCKSNADEEASFKATGVVKIIIQSAHIGHVHGLWMRPPSPFVSIHVNSTHASTDAQIKTYDPSWMEQTFFLLVKSTKEEIKLILYDHHAHRKHGLLGAASFDMSRINGSGVVLDAHLPLLKAKKPKGDLLCSLFYYPISTSMEDKNTVGIVRLIVSRVEDLRPTEVAPGSLVVAKARLGLETPSIYVTPYRILSKGAASWEGTHEFLCFDKSTCVVYIDVLNLQEDRILGHVSLCLIDLLEASMAGRRTWPLSGSTAGKLVASAEWRSLNLEPNL